MHRAIWTINVTWNDMFRDLGPLLLNEATDSDMRRVLGRFHVWAPLGKGESSASDPSISDESFNEVLVQFRALGMIARGEKKRGINDRASYWRITARGDRHLVSLLARRRGDSRTVPNDDGPAT